jgi:NADH-quinone oxidoreductase subunit D
MSLNFGPQHPAAHGVLRLILQLNGEVIEKADIHIGLLHRGSEKLIESKPYLQGLPYFDRFDYISTVAQEHAYCLAIESLLGTSNYNAGYTLIRSMFDELTRVLNHFLALASHAIDIGSMSPMLWTFEERERILEFFERVSGARMHVALYRPNDATIAAMSAHLLEDIVEFCSGCLVTINELHNTLTYNKIWKQRLVNIGSISYSACLDYGLTGVMSRSAGLKRDLRMDPIDTYANYYHLNFRTYLGQTGDSFDRYLIRMNEMVESLYLATQIVSKLTDRSGGCITVAPLKILSHLDKAGLGSTLAKHEYSSMEKLINHFKAWSEGSAVSTGWTYRAVESPKGEFGVSLLSDNSNKPHRCRVRSPAFHSLQALPKLARGHYLADLAALIGTIDIVFGEVDR